jgi:DNA polymerase V
MSTSDDAPLLPWVRVGRDRRHEPRAVRSSVAISFGSPAQDSGVARLDLNDVLIRHPQATFLMRATGDAMRDAGIENGDLLLVDRSIEPQHAHVVIAVVEGEFVCRRLMTQEGLCLRASDPAVADVIPGEGEQDLRVWGVVTTVVKSLPV